MDRAMSVIFFAVATLAAGVLSMDLLPGVFPADEALQLYLRIHDEYVPIPDDYIVELRPNSLRPRNSTESRYPVFVNHTQENMTNVEVLNLWLQTAEEERPSAFAPEGGFGSCTIREEIRWPGRCYKPNPESELPQKTICRSITGLTNSYDDQCEMQLRLYNNYTGKPQPVVDEVAEWLKRMLQTGMLSV